MGVADPSLGCVLVIDLFGRGFCNGSSLFSRVEEACLCADGPAGPAVVGTVSWH